MKNVRELMKRESDIKREIAGLKYFLEETKEREVHTVREWTPRVTDSSVDLNEKLSLKESKELYGVINEFVEEKIKKRSQELAKIQSALAELDKYLKSTIIK